LPDYKIRILPLQTGEKLLGDSTEYAYFVFNQTYYKWIKAPQDFVRSFLILIEV
jgi:hypothetical protein